MSSCIIALVVIVVLYHRWSSPEEGSVSVAVAASVAAIAGARSSGCRMNCTLKGCLALHPVLRVHDPAACGMIPPLNPFHVPQWYVALYMVHSLPNFVHGLPIQLRVLSPARSVLRTRRFPLFLHFSARRHARSPTRFLRR